MAQESISTLILFIAATLIAAAVGSQLVVVIADISESMQTRGEDVSEQISTDIEIINDLSAGTPYDSSAEQYEIYVKNTGDSILSTNAGTGETDVFINGQLRVDFNMAMADSSKDTWEPGTVVLITVPETTAPSGETTITVVTDGNEDTITFVA